MAQIDALYFCGPTPNSEGFGLERILQAGFLHFAGHTNFNCLTDGALVFYLR